MTVNVKIKRAIRAVAFFLLLFFVLYTVQDLVTAKYDWPSRNRRSTKSVTSVFNEPANTLDVIYLGGSQTFCSISPMNIYRDTGIRSYNLATVGQRVPVGYYLLKAAMAKQSPKLVVADASGFFYTEKQVRSSVSMWRSVIDSIPFRFLKGKLEMIDGLAELTGKTGDLTFKLETLIPMMRYHSKYLLERENYLRLHLDQVYQRKGYVATPNVVPAKAEVKAAAAALLEGTDPSQSDETELDTLDKALAFNEPYLRMLNQLCQENGSQLVFIKVPVCADSSERGYWSLRKHDMIAALAEDMGVVFWDMNYLDPEEVGLDWSRDSHDGDVHLNYNGAKKVSACLGRWLAENYSFEDNGDEKLKAQWDYQEQLFFHEMEYYDLAMELDLTRYLQRVQDGNYTLFTAVSGGVGEYWTDEDQKLFEEVTGSRLDLRQPENAAYVCASSDGKVILEKADPKACSCDAKLDDGLVYSMASKKGNADKNGTISIWGADYSCKGQGIHFVVYDNELKCAVESACFNTTNKARPASHSRKHQSVMKENLIEYVYKVIKKM